MPNYEVKMIAWTVVAVENAEDKSQAMEYAYQEVSTSDWEVDETTAHAVKDEDWETCKRHANHIAEDE